ncbi:MAG: hypothetical protein IPM50_15260 [Acidobacteriota bacterium]|nr:MAG: hypothetical protein IPM50_15260 [Acidobacteriota bacterium]
MVFLLLDICALDLFGQDKDVVSFEIPPEKLSLLFVNDPSCPLQISGPAKIIGYSNGGLSFGYSLANKSNANIESFLVEATDWFGFKGYSSPAIVNQGFVFAPGGTYDALSSEKVFDVRPFDDSIARKSGIMNVHNKIWIVMIVKVKLSDGSTYDVSQKFKSLSNFVEKPYSKVGMSEDELITREQQLREFVSKLMVSK